jgi:glycosyltransferase involved in cell wall biosynthesis
VFDNYGEKIPEPIAKKRLNLDPHSGYLLFFGFIREYKGLDLLLRAFADERLRKFQIKLLIAGEFYSNPDPYLNLIKELKLEPEIELRTEFIPDDEVNFYFSAADLVVQPYKSATQSGVTQIGYHFGKAMLVTRVGGLPEIIPHGRIGYVVNPESGEIADALVDFYENRRKVVFEKNVQEEKKRFSWEAMVRTLLEVFGEAMKKQKGSPEELPV